MLCVKTLNTVRKLLGMRLNLPCDHLRVLFNFTKNGQGDFERAQSVFAWDLRASAIGHRIQERFDFEAQRFFLGYRQRLESNLPVAGNGEGDGFLLLVVERDVLVWLEEAQLADALGGDAAGGEVGDATAGESQAHVGDVHFVGEDGDAGGADFFRERAGEMKNDVEVVNHEIQHDVNVETARAEQAEAMDFEKEWKPRDFLERGDAGVEALQMADLQNTVVLSGRVHQAARGGEVGGDRLFD